MLRDLIMKALPRPRLHRGQVSATDETSTIATVPHTGPAPGSDWWYAVPTFLVAAFCLLYGLGSYPLRDNNEGLYAEIAREMLATGQYLVPHLNGVPYFEKPPLLYWLVSLSMMLFGPTAAAARLVSALSMLALCAAIFQFCRLHDNARTGCFASVGLASALPIAMLSHVVMFDPLLCALLGSALLCFLHSYLTKSRSAYRLSAFLLALAILEKGALALVLAGGTVSLFLALAGKPGEWRRLVDRTALAIVLVVAGSWHLAVSLKQDGFVWFYFVNEHLLRFVGRRVPVDYHHGPLWFYLPRILLMLLPWTPFMLVLTTASRAEGQAQRTIIKFCWAAILFPLVFFSMSQAKADYYMIVAAPPLLLWLALETVPRMHTGDHHVALGWGISMSCVVGLLLAVPYARPKPWSGWMAVLLILFCMALAALASRWFRKLRSPLEREIAVLAIALLASAAVVRACSTENRRSARDSSWHLARIIGGLPDAQRQIFIYRDFEDSFATLPFYLRHTVPVIDSTSRDMMFGCHMDSGAHCLSPERFRVLATHTLVAVAVRANRADDFLSMASSQNWKMKRVGERMVFFNTR